MNEFHKHLVEKFFPNVNYDDLPIGEIEKFIEQINYVCKAQRNACLREWTNTHFDYEIGCNILTAEITRQDYE